LKRNRELAAVVAFWHDRLLEVALSPVPVELGLVPPDRPTEILLSSLPGIGPNQLFEVTLEPQTGFPLNRPTGPILAVGKAVRL